MPFPAPSFEQAIGDSQITHFADNGIGLFNFRDFVQEAQRESNCFYARLLRRDDVFECQVIGAGNWLIEIQQTAVARIPTADAAIPPSFGD
jgi:hypothetical protein